MSKTIQDIAQQIILRTLRLNSAKAVAKILRLLGTLIALSLNADKMRRTHCSIQARPSIIFFLLPVMLFRDSRHLSLVILFVSNLCLTPWLKRHAKPFRLSRPFGGGDDVRRILHCGGAYRSINSHVRANSRLPSPPGMLEGEIQEIIPLAAASTI